MAARTPKDTPSSDRFEASRPLTKIVATIGPATQHEDALRAIIAAGVDVLRLNFSHGTHADHAAVIERTRRIEAETGRTIALLQDLQGPKLRVGPLENGGPVRLDAGAIVRIAALDAMPEPGTAARIATTYPHLAEDLRPGDRVLLDDGAMELRVESAEPAPTGSGDVVCRVVQGGELRERKGVNLPGAKLRVPALTAKDEEDLAFGIAHGVDLVALSFVRTPDDIRHAKRVIRSRGGRQPVIAKIEKPQAVEALEAIIRVSDGIMVARGDLGVELSPEAVPAEQKRAIRLANNHGIPVITATQMLESMMNNARPTRAEASDVANAILDGTDAVMLSGETAVGAHPLAAVEVMNRIARETERSESYGLPSGVRSRGDLDLRSAAAKSDAHAIARAAKALALALPARLVVVLTASGRTASIVARERPSIPIVALTGSPDVARRLAVWHGVVPVVTARFDSDALAAEVDRLLTTRQLAHSGDRVVIVDSPGGLSRTHGISLRVHRLAAPEAKSA